MGEPSDETAGMSYGHAGTDLLATMIAMMTRITMIVMIRH